MPFLPVVLWTDLLIYLLLAVVVASVFYIRKRPHLITPWQAVIKRKRGMISIMILLCYVLVGLLDSIHFRLALDHDDSGQRHYSSEVLTVLDLALMPLRLQEEKTYSSPFATRLFVREMINADDGTLVYDYPKLTYAGGHLGSEQDRWSDIQKSITKTSIIVFISWLTLSLLMVIAYCRCKRIDIKQMGCSVITGSTNYPIRTALLMLLLIALFVVNLIVLSGDYHVFGTDKVGQDVLYQTLKSVRTGLVIGTLTTLVMLPVALFMGIAAGYFKGWIDDLIQYIYTTLNSIPGVLLIAAAVLMLQVYMNNHPENFVTVAERADMRLLFLCIILGMTSWTGLCRILRGETLKLREADYVVAAKALGVNNLTILHRHILPNLMHIVLIAIVLDFSGLVLAEAVLSYVGVGVDPSMISWGNMINSARLEMAREPIVWWSLTAAFFSMFVLVLAANLFADVVRDAFDPRMQGSR